MHIALATSEEYKAGYRDSGLLISALHDLGIDVSLRVWDDTSVNWSDFDAVLLHTTWDYTDKYDAFLSWCKFVSEHSKLLNNLDGVKLNSTKHYLLKLQDCGIA